MSLLLLILAFVRKKNATAVFSTLFLLLNAALVFGVYTYRSETVDKKATHTHRALLFNINSNNAQLPEIRAFIQKNEPDVVVLLELTKKALDVLALKELGYLYDVQQTRNDNFGIGLFSKRPITESKVVVFGDRSVPSVAATIDFGSSTITIIGSHPLPPIGWEYSQARNLQLSHLARFVSDHQSRPIIVMMDMNATPWSHVFHEFEKESGLRDSRKGFGIHATWPSWMPFFTIPIDHIFVSSELVVVSRTVGPAIGSDHYPVTIDFITTN